MTALLPLLTVIVPAAAAVLVWLVPARFGRLLAGLALAVVAVAAVALAASFYLTPGAGFRHVDVWPWFPDWGIAIRIGVDGLAAALLALSGLIGVVAWVSSATITTRVTAYHSLLLLLMAGANGVFITTDWVCFYICWEVMLIPMFLLIAVWGGEQRRYAATKFFVMTMGGSVLMLVVILGLYFRTPAAGLTVRIDPAVVAAQAVENRLHGLPLIHATVPAAMCGEEGEGAVDIVQVTVPRSFDMLHHALLWQHWTKTTLLGVPLATSGFLLLFLAFAIKVPVIPFHTWLPHAHVQAPTAISVILAGILLKLGVFGFLRIAWPIFPTAAISLGPVLAGLALVCILGAAWIALMQRDLKRLVAYSSISHMGFCLLGTVAATPAAMTGAAVQAVTHGLGSAMLFLLVGVVYDRVHHRRVDGFGGLATPMPYYAGMFLFAALGAAGLPGLAGFIGEFLTVLGTVQSNAATWSGASADLFRWFGFAAAGSVVLSAAYLLWVYQRMFTGPVAAEHRNLPDLTAREWLALAPCALLTLAIGVYPALVTRVVGPSCELLAHHLAWIAAR